MHAMTMWAAVAAMVLMAGTAGAQGGPATAASAANAPRMGPMGPGIGAGTGPGMGRGPSARWGANYTPGWAMMSPQEREQHRAQMLGAKTRDECLALMDAHHKEMVERAKQQGRTLPAKPRRDACAAFKE